MRAILFVRAACFSPHPVRRASRRSRIPPLYFLEVGPTDPQVTPPPPKPHAVP